MSVSLVEAVTPELARLWQQAFKDVAAKRGGAALLATLGGSLTESELLLTAVATRSLWSYEVDGELQGFCLCRAHLIEAVYVDHAHRRQKVATALVRALLDSDVAPVDAYALPGDRGTKSLYESLGWKARLLTMRGE